MPQGVRKSGSGNTSLSAKGNRCRYATPTAAYGKGRHTTLTRPQVPTPKKRSRIIFKEFTLALTRFSANRCGTLVGAKCTGIYRNTAKLLAATPIMVGQSPLPTQVGPKNIQEVSPIPNQWHPDPSYADSEDERLRPLAVQPAQEEDQWQH